MFFVGLAGIDGKVDYCGIAKGCSCPGCGGQSPFHVSKQYNCFHLFFLPLKKFHIIYELGPEKGAQAEAEGVVTISRMDLAPIRR